MRRGERNASAPESAAIQIVPQLIQWQRDCGGREREREEKKQKTDSTFPEPVLPSYTGAIGARISVIHGKK